MSAVPRFLAAFLLGLAGAGPAAAPATAANALELLNAFLAQAAAADPTYRTDVKLGDPPQLSAGRLAASSSLLGSFSYRPRTYDELSRTERAALLRDPALPGFLAARRPARPPEAGAETPTVPPSRLRRFTVTAEEMLGSSAVRVVLPPP